MDSNKMDELDHKAEPLIEFLESVWRLRTEAHLSDPIWQRLGDLLPTLLAACEDYIRLRRAVWENPRYKREYDDSKLYFWKVIQMAESFAEQNKDAFEVRKATAHQAIETHLDGVRLEHWPPQAVNQLVNAGEDVRIVCYRPKRKPDSNCEVLPCWLETNNSQAGAQPGTTDLGPSVQAGD